MANIMQVNVLEAKNQLSRLIRAATEEGEDVVIAKDGVPMVRLTPIIQAGAARQPGSWADLPPAASDWDSPAENAAVGDLLSGRAI